MRTWTPSLLLLLAVASAACQGSPTISASDYSNLCSKDADCTPVLVGELCECVCSYAAINLSDLPRYTKDRGDISCAGGKVCGPCQQAQAGCSAGRCAVK